MSVCLADGEGLANWDQGHRLPTGRKVEERCCHAGKSNNLCECPLCLSRTCTSQLTCPSRCKNTSYSSILSTGSFLGPESSSSPGARPRPLGEL
eukprot:750329-Hanusia_phi.AAC.3